MKTLFVAIGMTFALILTWLGNAKAETFVPTIYSDGYSCPGNCDAHVVFKKSYNGTKYASLPTSPRTNPEKCVVGQPCRICFTDADTSCLAVMYRGNGPDVGRFDFTPAFYEQFCPQPDLPKALVSECASFDKLYAKLTSGKIYCLAEPDHSGCAAVIAAAEASKSADRPLWDECRQLTQTVFNEKYSSSKAKQRDNDCAYELHGTGGPNSKGQRWARLLPAACQPGAYVGRDGTDCCDKNKMSLGGLGGECTPFLVPK